MTVTAGCPFMRKTGTIAISRVGEGKTGWCPRAGIVALIAAHATEKTSVPDGLTSSAAFLQGDLMTVWLLNGADRPVPAVKVDLGPRTIADGAVKTVRWGPENGREGTIGEATPITKNALVADVAAQTLLCFEFKVK